MRMLDRYIVEWREILEQKSSSETDYLILSDEGDPLSHSSLTQLFLVYGVNILVCFRRFLHLNL